MKKIFESIRYVTVNRLLVFMILLLAINFFDFLGYPNFTTEVYQYFCLWYFGSLLEILIDRLKIEVDLKILIRVSVIFQVMIIPSIFLLQKLSIYDPKDLSNREITATLIVIMLINFFVIIPLLLTSFLKKYIKKQKIQEFQNISSFKIFISLLLFPFLFRKIVLIVNKLF